jgi:hypothetical protein
MAQQKWETQSGLPTTALMYEQLTEHLILAQENCLMLSHLVHTEDGIKDKALALGWQAVAERLRVMQAMVTSMAQGRLQ